MAYGDCLACDESGDHLADSYDPVCSCCGLYMESLDDLSVWNEVQYPQLEDGDYCW